eukprot:tig00000737_g3817.t1
MATFFAAPWAVQAVQAASSPSSTSSRCELGSRSGGAALGEARRGFFAGHRLRPAAARSFERNSSPVFVVVKMQSQKHASPQSDRPVKTSADFDVMLRENRLPIAFVGMSNTGKSFRSSQLAAAHGFHLVCIDDQIEQNIGPELEALGYSGIEGMAKWMGFPSDPTFKEKEDRYLYWENKLTAGVEMPSPMSNFCVDTTGSVIYLPEETLAGLRHRFLVVHFEATDDVLHEMIERYFEVPKPVIWGPKFDMEKGESTEAALRRCYPELLAWRRERYRELAHVNISSSVSSGRSVSLDDFLSHIRTEIDRLGSEE